MPGGVVLSAKRNPLALLRGGDRRSIGRAGQVAKTVAKDPKLFPELVAGLWSEDPLVCMRAADATEKITRMHPEYLQPYKAELLGLLTAATQQELRWHLAAMVPRLPLDAKEKRTVASTLKIYLVDRSSIVKTFALQGLAVLAEADPALQSTVTEILREATRTGTPAMKARARKLLARLQAP